MREKLEKPGAEDITYDEVYKTEDNLWNFLYFTGYLKKLSERFDGETVYLTLAIPNTEVKLIYRNTILDWFNQSIKKKVFLRCTGNIGRRKPMWWNGRYQRT